MIQNDLTYTTKFISPRLSENVKNLIMQHIRLEGLYSISTNVGINNPAHFVQNVP